MVHLFYSLFLVKKIPNFIASKDCENYIIPIMYSYTKRV